MSGEFYSAVVSIKDSLYAAWGAHSVFHHIQTDNLFLVTAQTSTVLNGMGQQPISVDELRHVVRKSAEDKSLADDACDAYIKSLLEQRLIKKLVE